MANNLSKRIAAAEAKVPQIPPVEAVICEEPWFLEFLASHNLDIEQLKQKGSIIAAMPLEALRDLRDRLLVMGDQQGAITLIG